MADAGWFPDPMDPAMVRYFDGTNWTEHTQPNPQVAAAPPTAPYEPVQFAQTSTDLVPAQWSVGGAQLGSIQGYEVAPAAAQEAVLVEIGEIAVTQNWLITPSGSYPLAGMQFQVQEMVTQQERIPPFAIVLAIVFFLVCLLGLLFLLMKQTVVSGSVTVTVSGPNNFSFVTSVPARNVNTVNDIRQKVEYARSLVRQVG
ncbi:MAG: DUF2510 domain-containing protein [Microthrixaceae bacterium]